jgi:SAM-dependent MidA family methyltransferase
MECALYHPEGGYYRSGDRFGRAGDFFTAEQLQPVFGELLHTFVEQLADKSALTPFEVVELGAGRADLAPFLQPWSYRGVDFQNGTDGTSHLPGAFTSEFNGLFLAHELFDALPVRLLQRSAESWQELAVTENQEGELCFTPMEVTRLRTPGPTVTRSLWRVCLK